MAIISAIITALGIPVLTSGIASLTTQASNIGTYLAIGLGILLIIAGIFFRLIKKLIIYPIMKVVSFLISIALVCVCIMSGFLYFYGNADTTDYNEDYLLVLGCGVNGYEPSDSLKLRLDKALEYYEKNPDCTIIVSGGQGKGENITEAEAMKIYLVDRGVDSNKIVEEKASTSTTENFIFSNNFADGGFKSSSAVFITNDYHIFRANSLAKINGFTFNHLCADTPLNSIIPSYLRENLALLKMFVLKE